MATAPGPRLIAAGLSAAQLAALTGQTALEFLTGFVVEKSLSVDNIFVFVVVFSYFAIPPVYQHRVLFCGILGAQFFLLAGVMHRLKFLKYGLGLILVFVGLKMVWLNEAFGGKFPVTWSLAVIGGILAVAIGASLALSRNPAPRP